jgi:hypothetical protein
MGLDNLLWCMQTLHVSHHTQGSGTYLLRNAPIPYAAGWFSSKLQTWHSSAARYSSSQMTRLQHWQQQSAKPLQRCSLLSGSTG